MFTILIVDDEPRQVKALVSVVRQLKPDYTVIEAFDGDEALEIVYNNSVNIIISDINMPNLNGISLIKIISHIKNPPKIVMLTGYDDFEFAVQALRHQAFDYLLKPIGKPELVSLLERLESLLLEEQKFAHKLLTDEQRLVATIPIYEQYLMNQWIHSRTNHTEMAEIRELFEVFCQQGAVILFVLNNRLGYTDEEMSPIVHSLQHSVQQQFIHLRNICIFQSSEDNHTLISPYLCETPAEIRKLVPILDRLTQEYGPESGLCLTISIGPVVEDLIVNAPLSFVQAKLAQKNRFYRETHNVIMASDSFIEYSSRFPFKEEFSFMMKALHEDDEYAIHKLITAHLEKLKTQQCDPDLVKDEWYSFILQMAKTIRNHFGDHEYKSWLLELKKQLYAVQECYELKPILSSFLLKIKAVDHNRSKTQHEVIVDQCILYISQNYNMDISLEEISHKYHFHPSYFSTLFKSIAGIGFSEYMQKVRIDEAKRLILNTNKKMSEVALCVGYRDAAYFNKTFKKEIGISPNKYKRIQMLE